MPPGHPWAVGFSQNTSGCPRSLPLATYPDLHLGALALPLLPRDGGAVDGALLTLRRLWPLFLHHLPTARCHSASTSPGLPPTPLCPPYLAQDEGHHVGGFPVAGMEEVGQGDGGESGQGIGAVQRVVNALWAPPALQDCRESWNEAFSQPQPLLCSLRCPHGMGWVVMTLTLDNLTGAGRSGGFCWLIALPKAPKAASGGRGSSHIHFGQEQGRVCLQGLR